MEKKAVQSYLNCLTLTQFDTKKINWLKENSFIEENNGVADLYIKSLVLNQKVKLTPKEILTQLSVLVLNQNYGYPVDKMVLKYAVLLDSKKQYADIVVLGSGILDPKMIVKIGQSKEDKEQLKKFCDVTGAQVGILVSENSVYFYYRKNSMSFETISNIPSFGQNLSDVLKKRWTTQNLVNIDEKTSLYTETKRSLKDFFVEMEEDVFLNSGMDSFDEILKLFFVKLYDENQSVQNTNRYLEFRNYGYTERELKNKIQNLFDEAKREWTDVFIEYDKIMLSPSHLSACVSLMQDIKFSNMSLDFVREAFEYLVNKNSKGEKGQYFTPRYVVDMCVEMINPKPEETLIDTAAGSNGFLLKSISHVCNNNNLKNVDVDNYTQNNVFAIDFDQKIVRMSKIIDLIVENAGQKTQINVLHLNTLDFNRWDIDNTNVNNQETKQTHSQLKMSQRFKRLRTNQKSNRNFDFDVVLTTPPFGGKVKDNKMLSLYNISKNANNKQKNGVSREVLFIERNLDFLKPGGRMAIVLPQGIFNNKTNEQTRKLIVDQAKVLAVVGLPKNIFKPYADIKTSVLIVQKWNDDPTKGLLCPKVNDYPIFFSVMQESVLNYSVIQNNIVRPFVEFAKKEKFSFV